MSLFFFHDFMTLVFRILILIYSMESPWLSIIAFLSPYLLSWIPPTRKSPIDILYNIDYSSSKYGWIVKWFLKVDKSKLYRRFQFQWQQEKKFDSSNHWFQLVSKWPYRSNVQVEISENNKSSEEKKGLDCLVEAKQE